MPTVRRLPHLSSMRRIPSLIIAALALASVAIRVILVAPAEDPDISLLLLPSMSAFEPPPPPPIERLDPRPAPLSWRPPTWLSPPTARPYPIFAVTSWAFPNYSCALEFYRESEARFVRVPPHISPAGLLQLARRSASQLAAACTSPRVGIAVRRLVQLPDVIRVPLVLHRVNIDRRPIWVLIMGTTNSAHSAFVGGSLYDAECYLLLPWSGEVLYHTAWW